MLDIKNHGGAGEQTVRLVGEVKMNLCDSNKEISRDLAGFIKNVPDVKEESITDYLTWRWKESDNKFNYIDVTPFTREQENKTTGADFEIELWLVGRTIYIPLLIQAKKLIPKYNSYCNKLNYPNGSQGQLNKLLSHSKTIKRIPFYIFYSLPDKNTDVLCGGGAFGNLEDCSIFLTDAFVVQDFANNYKNKKLSKNMILKKSNPFHCIFCCPHGNNYQQYFGMYYPNALQYLREWQIEFGPNNVPEYVRLLLSDELNSQNIRTILREFQLDYCRKIAVYDISHTEESLTSV